MNKEQESGIAVGLNKMGNHVGSGIAWLGFLIFLGMLMVEITPIATT